MGWVISAYQEHLRVNHGGGIDGFSALVTLFPSDSLGIVILTNLGGNPIPEVVANNIFDRLSGFDPVDWNKILSEQRKQAEKAKDENAVDAMRVPNTQISHPLGDYTGKYEEAAYGELKIELVDGKLVLKDGPMELPMEHYHYDIFEAEHDVFGKFRIKFEYNAAGEISQLSIPLEPSVDDIVFTRQLEEKELSTEEMEYYTGKYLIAGTTIKVYITGDNKLKMFVPGQPEYDLVQIKKHQFIVPTLKGYSVRFEPGKSQAKTMVLIQPNGTFRAERE